MPVRGLRKFHQNVGRKLRAVLTCPQTLPIRSEVAGEVHLLQEISDLCRYFRMCHLRGWCAVNCLRLTWIAANRKFADASNSFVEVRIFEHR